MCIKETYSSEQCHCLPNTLSHTSLTFLHEAFTTKIYLSLMFGDSYVGYSENFSINKYKCCLIFSKEYK